MAETSSIDDPEIASDLASLADEMRNRLVQAVQAAVECGELDTTVSPTELGTLIASALQGAHLSGRTKPDGSLRADALRGLRQILDHVSTDRPKDS